MITTLVAVTEFDWAGLSAARNATQEAVPEMVNRALRVLEDLLEETDHACTFTLVDGPLTGDDVGAAVDALLPANCRVSGLEPVDSWSATARAALPGMFVPGRQPHAWAEQGAARMLAEALADWAVALMGRLWPASAESWTLTVHARDWYEGAYVDLVVRVRDRVWLLHLGVSD
ncbi:hypothetical protein C6361_21850 [Plantactinospora sp. BC1]|nr:hypothetical protein C6361_21850 [Plantactinospora sp. BC1]